MSNLSLKSENLARRKNRIRSTVAGTTERPRMTVTFSNLHVTAQIIDDTNSKTLVYASTVGKKVTGNLTEKAQIVGTEIATKAKKAKIEKVVLDRNGKKYHGRVKAFADAAREAGLEF